MVAVSCGMVTNGVASSNRWTQLLAPAARRSLYDTMCTLAIVSMLHCTPSTSLGSAVSAPFYCEH